MAELADAPDLGSGVTDVGVRVPLAAPKQTEIEPDIHFCKRCCGLYLCKVRKKHKVLCLVLFVTYTNLKSTEVFFNAKRYTLPRVCFCGQNIKLGRRFI